MHIEIHSFVYDGQQDKNLLDCLRQKKKFSFDDRDRRPFYNVGAFRFGFACCAIFSSSKIGK